VLLLSSDLARARETAAFLEKATGLTAEEDPRLREYDVGMRTGLTRAEFAERLGDDAALAWDTHAHVEAPGAETVTEVAERIVPATREAFERLGAGETGVLVTHGAALRIAVAGLLGWPLEIADTLEAMTNCGWATVVEHTTGRLRLSSYNMTAAGPPPD
jgi:broad specificity phosphatase PhoE